VRYRTLRRLLQYDEKVNIGHSLWGRLSAYIILTVKELVEGCDQRWQSLSSMARSSHCKILQCALLSIYAVAAVVFFPPVHDHDVVSGPNGLRTECILQRNRVLAFSNGTQRAKL
jgi:hypothetical protein